MEFIKDFKDLSKNDTSIAGGKGASLSEMTQVDIPPVPPGFVILSSAFDKFLEETDLNVEIDAILHSVNHKEIHTINDASEKIKVLILRAEMPKNISEEIQKFFKKLGLKYVAVRSSATVEDSATAAWAGQLESYLNTTEENLLENVKKCWASLFTPRAIFYRFEKGLHKQKISVAVVVQKMIDSEVSGVAFSVHPVTQDRNQLIIEASFGLGEAIVSGQITPDSYVVEKEPRRIIDKNVQTQKRKLCRSEKGGNEWRDIPKKQGEKQVLPDKEILELSDIIVRIENHYGFPVDIEWVKEKEKFYIVQSRPITTLQHIQDSNFKFDITSADFVLNYQAKGDWDLILCDFFRNNSKDVELMSFVSGRRLDHFITQKFKDSPLEYLWKTVFEKLLEILADNKKFENFKEKLPILDQEFRSAAQKVRKDPGNKILFIKFLDTLNRVGHYYRLLDFDIFPEDEKKIAKRHPEAYENFKKVGKIKNDARKVINKLLLEKENLFKKTFKAIGQYFSVGDDILYYTIDEIKELYNNEDKLSHKEIKKRKEVFLILTYKGCIYRYFGKEAKNKMSEFYSSRKGTRVSNFKGTVAFCSQEKVIGQVKVFNLDFSSIEQDVRNFIGKINKNKEKIILVSDVTTPEMAPIFKKVSAIITAHGGLNTHAAINAREMKIPAIVGVKGVLNAVKDGDLVEVDTNKGIVRRIK